MEALRASDRDWENNCMKVLEPFCNEDARKELAMRQELRCLVAGNVEDWRQEVDEVKRAFGLSATETVDRDATARCIEYQKQLLDSSYDPVVVWDTHLKHELSLLYEAARRLLDSGTQSADVERCCKAHKQVYTKGRNSLRFKNGAFLPP